jgi:orotate phosphoribosyltransferase
MNARERLLNLFVERSFRLGDFILSSGRKSDFYIDCRTTTMHAEGQVLLGEVGLDLILETGLSPDLVGGLTMGADPIAYAIAGESFRRGNPIHAFSVRKRAKRHGTGRQIEGCFESGARVVVVEDVITTGGSALQACEAVKAEQGTVLMILAAVDRQEGGREAIEQAGYRVESLFGVDEFRATLQEAESR